MKNLLIGITLLLSFSIHANEYLEDLSHDLKLEIGQKTILANFSSCIYGAVDIQSWKGTCKDKIPKLMDMGLSDVQIKTIIMNAVDDHKLNEDVEKSREDRRLEIEDFIDSSLKH